MSKLDLAYFEMLTRKIFELHDVQQFGTVKEPENTQCRNRAGLIFSLDAILEKHRSTYGSPWSPLVGRRALEHLLIQKHGLRLSEIRSLNLSDIVLLLQEELHPDNIPEAALSVLKNYNLISTRHVFPDILDEEWDPNFYLTIPKQRDW